jgi:hypothetical protein
MRLRHTVVLYRDTPVYIKEVRNGDGKDGIFRVLFTEIPLAATKSPRTLGEARLLGDEEDAQRKFISSKYFDIAPFKMGYVNRPTGSGAFYCSRLPNRMQKQGLSAENFIAKDNNNSLVDFNTFIKTKEVLEMVANKYPTFDAARRALAKVPSVAFSRDFCLVKDAVVEDFTWIYYKGDKVGMFAGESITLGNKFKCLKESLQELGLTRFN